MNMPPLAYLRRIPGLDVDALRPAYTDAGVWDSFDPACITLCSPDPQAIRPPEEKVNVLQVTLPTNFKVARFRRRNSTPRCCGGSSRKLRRSASIRPRAKSSYR